MTVPWNLAAVTVLGLGMMAAPDVFDVPRRGLAADSDHLIGALIAVTAVIAWAEILRSLRFLNVLLGAWVVIAAWWLSDSNWQLALSDTLAGLAIIVLSLPRGPVLERYGTWARIK